MLNYQRQHKYNAKRTIVDGITFDSRKEANRYSELKLLERAGKITDLKTQVRFALEVNGILISHYVADFQYFDKEKGLVITEDAKGFLTDIYRMKKKMMRALYGIEILET